MAQAGFAQQVKARGDSFPPQFFQGRQGGPGVGASDEMPGQAPNLRSDALGQQAFGQSAQLQAGRQQRRKFEPRLAQVIN